jgi:hypothetical protein
MIHQSFLEKKHKPKVLNSYKHIQWLSIITCPVYGDIIKPNFLNMGMKSLMYILNMGMNSYY